MKKLTVTLITLTIAIIQNDTIQGMHIIRSFLIPKRAINASRLQRPTIVPQRSFFKGGAMSLIEPAHETYSMEYLKERETYLANVYNTLKCPEQWFGYKSKNEVIQEWKDVHDHFGLERIFKADQDSVFGNKHYTKGGILNLNQHRFTSIWTKEKTDNGIIKTVAPWPHRIPQEFTKIENTEV